MGADDVTLLSRKRVFLIFFVLIVGLFSLFVVAEDTQRAVQTPPDSVFVDSDVLRFFEEGREAVDVIVWLKDNELTSPSYQEDLEQKKTAIQKVQDRVLSVLESDEFHLKFRYMVTNGFAGTIRKSGFEKLVQHGDVAQIFYDGEVHAFLDESRLLIDADDVQSLGTDGSGVNVCVLDSGIDYAHTNLGGCFGPGCKVVMGYDFCNGPNCSGLNDTDPMDEDGHGTHIAGIIASSNSTYKGISPGVTLGALKVLNASGSGTFGAVAAGIDFCTMYAVPFNTKVITMSLGGGGPFTVGTCPSDLNPVIQNALQAKIFIDAASGNDGYTTGVSYPACAAGVTSVGAVYDEDIGVATWQGCTDFTTAPDKVTCFSNRGVNLDLLAPGAMITSTVIGNTFGDGGGTSQAAPHVAGLAALLYAISPSATPLYMDSILKLSGKRIYDSGSSLNFPRVDARAAARMAANPDGWLNDRRITFNSSTSAWPSVAVDSNGNVHIVWVDSRNGNYDLYYNKLNNMGVNLTSDIRLTTNPADSYYPAIALDSNGFVHVVWHDYAYGQPEIFYKKLNNNGLAVTPDIRLTNTPFGSTLPAIAVDSNNNIHVAWQGNLGGGYDVFYKKLNTNGLNLTPDIRITGSGYPHSEWPSLALTSTGQVHIVWRENYNQLNHAKLDNNGIILIGEHTLTNAGFLSSFYEPSLAVDSQGNLHIATTSTYSTFPPVLVYFHVNETGSMIGPGLNFGNAAYPSVAVDSSNNVHFVWEKAESPSSQGELYYAKANTIGSILVPSTRLTFDPAPSDAPSLSVRQGKVHVVWQDTRDGNYEIYYKSTTTGIIQAAQVCLVGSPC